MLFSTFSADRKRQIYAVLTGFAICASLVLPGKCASAAETGLTEAETKMALMETEPETALTEAETETVQTEAATETALMETETETVLTEAETETALTEAETETAEAPSSVMEGLIVVGNHLLYAENGQRIRNDWRTIDGHSYYFGKNGAAVKGLCRIHGKWYVFDAHGRLADGVDIRIITVDGSRYFVDKKGHPISGWQIYNGQLYYAHTEPEGFSIVTSGSFDRIDFDERGRAVESTNRALKIRTMEILPQITTPDMDRAAKLRACWNYVCSSRFSYFGNYPDMNDPNWPRQLAWEFFSQGGGNCYGFAVSFCALAHEIGYDPVVVHGLCPGSRDRRPDGLTRHCCLSIDGLYYDPEGTYAGWAAGIYGTSYSSLVAINGTLPF